MKTWKIVSSAGVDMGTYEGQTREDALDAMARDAGYKSQAETPEPFEGTVIEAEPRVCKCIYCGHPIPPEGIWLTDREDVDLDDKSRERCSDSACVA